MLSRGQTATNGERNYANQLGQPDRRPRAGAGQERYPRARDDGGDVVTKALPYTKAGLTRRIVAAMEAGLFVIGIAPDGTVLTGPAPKESPQDLEPTPRKLVRL
jgi:hypothetical protein